ncbi:hypothetical protein PWG14_27445 [Chromobacterium amazonense]|uniref:hypothetical protein n=1 Tax=Chromobacterium amazonense TaxID=1382803 RepID=UPI00237E4E62|nr:hypothetical protein [Chromobacterium amazonense]MDE1716204.1 hypothetical protein [Chromobacterium amazonense]
MREELMTEALCWELDAKISAIYAHKAQHLTFFCPDENCLVEVRPKKLKNVYFYAPTRHEPGCMNEGEKVESSPVPGVSKPKPSPSLVDPVPTLLGPGPFLRQKSTPTKADLLTLARQAKSLPLMHPGTLEEVISAWVAMTSPERSMHPLQIGHQRLTYQTAFSFLANASDDVTQLDYQGKIIFGAASIGDGKQYIFVTSKKTFSHDDQHIPVRLDIKKSATTTNHLLEHLGNKATFFWHGAPYELATSGKAYLIKPGSNPQYTGVTVREGYLSP